MDNNDSIIRDWLPKIKRDDFFVEVVIMGLGKGGRSSRDAEETMVIELLKPGSIDIFS